MTDAKETVLPLVKHSNERGRLWISALIMVLAFAFLAISPFVELLGGSKEVVSTLIPIISATLSGVLGWIFGSSFGSAKKQDTIDRVIK